MQTIHVRDLMSSPVIAISPRTPLPQIQRLMREQHIRRLPVVDRDRLVGVITSGDVRSAMPSDATSLSIYELSYLLEEVTAAEVMRSHVITITASASLAEAAKRMLDYKISGMPVVERGQLVGIISESDIFRAIVGGMLSVPSNPPVAADTDILPALSAST